MWDDPLHSVHVSLASDCRTYKECWSDFDFWAFFTNYKIFFILNSVKLVYYTHLVINLMSLVTLIPYACHFVSRV
jgi:hypothetical protein